MNATARAAQRLGALSLILLGLLGCGSAAKSSSVAVDSSAAPITKSEFVRRANAICAKGNAESRAGGAKLGSEPSEARVIAFVKGIEVPALQAQIRALRALGAPPGDEDTVTKLLTLAQAAVDAVRRTPTIVTSGIDVFARFARVAHPYGLTSCAPTG